MREHEVRDLAKGVVYQGSFLKGKIEETHISWVVLTRNYAFKIKKPVKLSFLDFSTLELRRQFCEKEVILNRRFTDIYLSALPVSRLNDQWYIGESDNYRTVDYCVVMRRMAVAKRLDNVLQKGGVTARNASALALEVASFHSKAERIFTPFDLEAARNTFNDIRSIADFASHNLDADFGQLITHAIGWSDLFLEKHQDRIRQRISHGLKRDVHGDLHCGNIFLYRIPVLFDCIEFNDTYRQIDVLYELAFLCMDLERYGQKSLAEIFLAEYGKHFPAFQEREDDQLFTYFKSLRAGIRAKVHALQAMKAETKRGRSYQLAETNQYLNLLRQYMANAPGV